MASGYPLFPDRIPDMSSIRSGHYSADFARGREELEEVQRLRFQVFNLELGEGLEQSYATRKDEDPYDAHCHHLIIRDEHTGELVGTYRMQDAEMASGGNGFYSDSEFHLEQLPADLLARSLELGRACIAEKHRSGRVLFLLWRGLLYYLQKNNLQYFFGCCSLASQDPEEGWALHTRLMRAGHMTPDLHISPRGRYVCEKQEPGEEVIAHVMMPRLMRLYLDYGARMCSAPALDREFKTIDFLALFHLDDISPKLRTVFEKDLV